jgi:large subunit ribosomal protein L23
MTVELAKPFQWPELPEDKTPWSNQLFQMREDMLEKRNKEHIAQQRFEIPLKSKQLPSKERQELANMAQKLLSGEEKWTNDVILDPKWEKILNKEEAEVKKDANEA